MTQRDLDLKVSRDGFNTLPPLRDDALPISLNNVFDSFLARVLQFYYNFVELCIILNPSKSKLSWRRSDAKDINGYKRNFLIERLRLQNISAVIGSSWYTCTIHQSSQKFVENRHVQNISINVIHPLKIPWSFVQRSILQSEYMNRSFITGYTKKCWIMTEVNAATETRTNLLLVLWGSRKACDSKLDILQGLEEYFRDLRFDQKTVRDSGKLKIS